MKREPVRASGHQWLWIAGLLCLGLACRSGEPAASSEPAASPTPSPPVEQSPPEGSGATAAWRQLDWVVTGSGREVGDESSAGCADFDLTAQQLGDFIDRATAVGDAHELDFYPCWVTAEAQSSAGKWTLRLRIGGVANLHGPDAADSAVLHCADCPELD